MACTLLTSGICRDCDNNAGGVTKLYITDLENVTSVTATSGTISAIGLASGTTFYEFAFNKNTSTFSEKTTISIENGSTFYEQTISLVIPRREVSKRNVLALMVQKPLAVIVKDANGLYWLVGEVEGAYVTEVASDSGKAKGDLNGYTITMIASEASAAQEVNNSIIAGLITAC